MGRILTLASFAVGLVALMPGDVGAEKKKKQEIADIATDQDYKTLQSIKDMTGKIGSVNTNSITFRLDIPRLDPNPKYKPPKGTSNQYKQLEHIYREQARVMTATNPI